MTLHEQVESSLRAAAWRWRFLRVAGGLALCLGVSALAWLLFGFLTAREVVRHPAVFVGIAVLLFFLSASALLVMAIAASVKSPTRGFLARQLERVHPGLLDRLNTLVWLEGRGAPDVPDGYRKRLEWQARGTLAYDAPAPVFSSRQVWWRWAASLAMAAAAIGYWWQARPWTHLEWRRPVVAESPAELAEKMPAPDEAAASEMKKGWGEVRITEPGRDLKVTKVDVVPLQIEAASSAALDAARYVTAVGGGKSQPHALPAPAEPHYAVYKPVLYVDEFRLSDWDVLTYYASAGTRDGKSYASDVYFLEVRPFREDILKLPGGEGGSAYKCLSKLSGLIDRQKHVIRETHGYTQRSYDRAERKREDRDKLAEAEGDLAEASRHLYAEVAAKMENADVGVVLDHLAQAEGHLDRAARSLAKDDAKAPEQERDAMTSLVATRKALQKAVSDNPKAFEEGESSDGEDPTPTAELEGKLKEIAEFRDEEKAARDLMDKAVARQKELAEQASRGGQSKELSVAQEKLRREVSEFAGEHPRLFKRAEKERAAADEAMREAAGAMASPKGDGASAARRAQEKLQALQQSVEGGAAGEDLRQAYELKEMIDAQAQGLGGVEKAPESKSADDLARAAREAKQTTRELKRLMDETPAGEAFGDPLHDALGPARQVDRERRLEAMAGAQGAEARRQAAREARSALENVSRAFEDSQPGVSKELRGEDSLKEGDEDPLDRALRRLDGLVAGAESDRPRAPQDTARQRRQIVEDLQGGVARRYHGQPKIDKLVRDLEEELTRVDLKVDPKKLRKLLDQIEQFRVETSQRKLAQGDAPRLKHIDPSKLPPAYRERIQKYYQKLAEEQ